jgi:hypothetical protein
MKKLFLVVFLCTAFLFMGTTAWAIPELGVAPGNPGDASYTNLSYDGFPMSPDGGELTVWFGTNSPPLDTTGIDLWLLTTSANGDDFSFDGADFTPQNGFADASYKTPIYGVDLGNPGSWTPLNTTFYSYDFGSGGHDFVYLTGDLDTGDDGAEIGDWMYVAYLMEKHNGDFAVISSPKTTSSQAVPEPATLLLLGGGLVGLAGFGRKKFKK